MIVVVEIKRAPMPGSFFSPFEVTLDFDSGGITTSIGSMISEGSWSCLPGRLSLSGGYFEIDRFGDLRLKEFDDSISFWDTVKHIFGDDWPAKGKSGGILRDFGTWFELANGKSGRGTGEFHGGFDFLTWRIMSGAPR